MFEPRSNTMKLGTMKAQLPWSLEQADLSFCHAGGLGWDPTEALQPMGRRRWWGATSRNCCNRSALPARPGDHVLCMSNGGFGGIQAKLLERLAAAA